MYKAEIYHSVDLENSKQSHVSISGGKATHSFNYITTLNATNLLDLKLKVMSQYGKPYDTYENSMYLSIPESDWNEAECPENYEAIFSEVSEVKVKL